MADTTPKTEKKYMTADEKVYLSELVEKYINVIECKKTDCVNVAQKKKTWLQITKEFNSISENSCRTSKQLSKAWENVKTRRRSQLSSEKKERMATGGGVYKPPKADDVEIDVDGILNCVDIELKDSIDSDTLVITGAEYVVNENNILIPAPQEDVPTPTTTLIDGIATMHRSNELQNEPHTVAVPEEGETSNPRRQQQEKLKKITYASRGTAVERELEVRLRRNECLQQQDAEIHALRLQEHQLRVEEQKLKVDAQKMKNKIVELQLKHEMLLIEQVENNHK